MGLVGSSHQPKLGWVTVMLKNAGTSTVVRSWLKKPCRSWNWPAGVHPSPSFLFSVTPLAPSAHRNRLPLKVSSHSQGLELPALACDQLTVMLADWSASSSTIATACCGDGGGDGGIDAIAIPHDKINKKSNVNPGILFLFLFCSSQIKFLPKSEQQFQFIFEFVCFSWSVSGTRE